MRRIPVLWAAHLERSSTVACRPWQAALTSLFTCSKRATSLSMTALLSVAAVNKDALGTCMGLSHRELRRTVHT